MTPDKCEHWGITKCRAGPRAGPKKEWYECEECGQRFVPSDVLEEARKALLKITRRGEPTEGLYCGACSATEHDEHETWCQAIATLARIDEVLGEK